MIKSVITEKFEASDGSTFYRKEDAERHEKILSIAPEVRIWYAGRALRILDPDGYVMCVQVEELIPWIKENSDALSSFGLLKNNS